jgi:hypothetical protein
VHFYRSPEAYVGGLFESSSTHVRAIDALGIYGAFVVTGWCSADVVGGRGERLYEVTFKVGGILKWCMQKEATYCR